MTAKRYRAETMADALAEVKRDLGRDAVILETRRCRMGGLWGLGGHRGWEIMASVNADAEELGTYASESPAAQEVRVDPPTGQDEDLAVELREIRGMLSRMSRSGPAASDARHSPLLGEVFEYLCEQDVRRDLATELTDRLGEQLTGAQLHDPGEVRGALVSMLASRLATAPPAESAAGPLVMAFVGPTGVGKTTTIAKLAANYRIHQRKRVTLVTIDTYRIAAVDQLKTYADIIEVPLRAVLSPGELHQVVHGAANADVILIDTTGRSPSDRMRLGQLRGFLDAAEPDQTHLVISATSGPGSATRAVEQFKAVGIDRVAITKLDEAATCGVVLNVAEAAGVPVSYTTSGQEVPDDIAPACSEQLAELIAGGYQA